VIRSPSEVERAELETTSTCLIKEIQAILEEYGQTNNQSNENESSDDLFGSSSEEDSRPEVEDMSYELLNITNTTTIMFTDNTAAAAAINANVTPNKNDSEEESEDSNDEDSMTFGAGEKDIDNYPKEIHLRKSSESTTSDITEAQLQHTSTTTTQTNYESDASSRSKGILQSAGYDSRGLRITTDNQTYQVGIIPSNIPLQGRLQSIWEDERDKLYEGDDEENEDDSIKS
jgi:glucan-binding YG repeat protein